MAAVEDPITRRGGIREFVRTEPSWDMRLGPRWEYQGRIRRTNRAIIAHFKYEDQEGEDNNPPHTKDVVVKIQLRRPVIGGRPNGYPENYDGFLSEGRFLQFLSGYYAWHPYDNRDCIPDRPHNILRHFHDQTVPSKESEPLNRNAISFLEYCPGIVISLSPEDETRYYDLDVFDRNNVEFIEEIDIWNIFRQFTRMILMMDCGSEIPRTTRQRRSLWETREMEICHYDIQPSNILIGYKNYEKDRVPVLKLCDFGDALQVPQFTKQQHAGRYSFPNQRNGRPGYQAPEQLIAETEHVNPFRHGTCSNIFQFANIIRLLMHGGNFGRHAIHPEDPDWCDDYFGEYTNTAPRTYGYSLSEGDSRVNAPGPRSYSERLIKIVQECMKEKPELRPRPLNLFHYINDGFRDNDLLYNDPDYPGPGENELHRPKKPHKPNAQIFQYPPIHPLFALATLAPPHFRTPQPSWEKDFSEFYDVEEFAWPPTPRTLTPDYVSAKVYNEDFIYTGDDLPEVDHETYPRSQPQVPERYPHGPPMIDQRPSVNIPDRRIDVPGGVARNLGLLKYYDRLGHMWMGEENYWKMLEAGLDPETYNWGMSIPDPEMDEDEKAMSGPEAGE
ncbi:uncharacterized protein EAF01_003496 [Botrytis porri]|uniref:Protein kinase domain-containing protein n=1 Tax=Botrytis porri TaxID=87229 RepID=A0A4Z1KLD3_9HELO|nr:uncharacterized protein EAF01_003496 [Botrytis porri]KAF7909778.1 hypothetical protein EAF01_003496 [Botrytis porri]TGO86863.1 hypothetical protein BPOR_0271g00070 [Botrytis porri]